MFDKDLRELVRKNLQTYIQTVPIESIIAEHGSPLLILDTTIFKQQYQKLQQQLPGVQHHYALKAFSHPAVIQAIKDHDGYLDVATDGEIDEARAVGFAMERCIHTHPIKKPSEIAYAYQAGIRRFVVDNSNEAGKFKDYGADVELMIRLDHSDPEASLNLSYKFGADSAAAKRLASQIQAQGNTLLGLCMHPGSQIHNPAIYGPAITKTVELIDEIEAELDIKLAVLDIGGGFPVQYRQTVPGLEDLVQNIMPILRPLQERFTVLAEPGRFVAAPAMLLISSVVGTSQRHGEDWYYLDDGVYGSFSNQIFEGLLPHIFALKELNSNQILDYTPSTLAGPTCDSIDIIAKHYPLPALAVGDVLISPMMGAYSSVTATSFNSIPKTAIHVL